MKRPSRAPRRTILLSLGLAAAVLVGSLSTPKAAEGDTKAAQAAFNAYVDALSTKNGEAAAKVVTESTVAFYETMRMAALTAPAKEVRAMSFMRMVFVLLLRVSLEPQQLRDSTARQIFVTAVDRGWIDAGVVARASLGKVSTRGDMAVAKMVVDGKELPLDWHLEREKGTWKNDLVPLVKFADAALGPQLKAMGKEPLDLAQDVIQAATGKKLPASAWDPPGAAGPRKTK